ncbi:hypothetical protein PhCBS80983_g04331 [Powellomyces hirtus]|uniref:LIM zinc-binding domain-containing protein n=1 Tax=Powellomyces hirtus TaxID=109895 RepID=A0A507E0Y2_9FUNG|nr:hypothetical protein PhCBS80983_g04331 [Powellomyces hirtus]
MSVADRLQFFKSLNNGTQQPTPTTASDNTAEPRSALHATQSLEDLGLISKYNDAAPPPSNAQSETDLLAAETKPLSIKERIAQYGPGADNANHHTHAATAPAKSGSNTFLSDIKARVTAIPAPVDNAQDRDDIGEDTRRPSVGAAESTWRRKESASRPAPYKASSSRHASNQDLHASRSGSATNLDLRRRSSTHTTSQQNVSEPVPMELSDPPAATLAAPAISEPPATVAPGPITPAQAVNPAPAQPAPPPTTSTTSTPKFGAAPPKCNHCAKPVYLMEQLVLDNNTFHKTCLKCSHCKATLKMGNLASMNGAYYCKPHFKQLFKLKGNYAEGFGLEDHKKLWVEGAAKEEDKAM